MHLSSAVFTNTEQMLYEVKPRIGIGGYNTAQMQAVIDTNLAAVSGTPNYVLYNMGAGDVLSLPAEATWKANTLYNIDAVHTKWPNALVFVAKPMRSGYTTECNTLAGWVDDVVAARSAWARVGIDERPWLLSVSDDGTHPNAAGYIRTGQEWKTALGL